MTKEMKALVKQAKLTGCTLFLSDEIRLVTYKESGEVAETYRYHYAEVDYISRIQHRLDEIIAPLRQTWGKEFLELAPVAFPLGYSITVGDYSAVLTGTTNSRGEVNKQEIELLECPFSRSGVHAMSDYIANVLLGDNHQTAKTEKEEQAMTNCANLEDIEMSDELAKVIAIIFYRLPVDEQQRLKNNSEGLISDTINKALTLAAQS